MERTNPIIKTDYPDPDVIRVEDTYYMISTTMHFCPGGAILRSYDLIHWEIAGYVFDVLDGTPEERMEGERSNYGHGMWAASMRYHQGKFYVSFGTIETDKTYIYTAEKVEGPWEKKVLDGYYHDSSLLFDEDGRVYMVYGNTEIKLVEMLPDVSGRKPGGLERVLLRETEDVYLGYEGSHIYRIEDRYYLFVLHWPKAGMARRTQMCFAADSLDGEFRGGVVLDDDRGYFNQGVAQGGIVDTPDGKWYSILFQDSGAVGRIPVLVPVEWKEGFPVFGIRGKVPAKVSTSSSRPYYPYEPLYTSDDFHYAADETGHARLKKQWQWNHEPNPELWSICPEGGLRIRTGKICINLTQAVNTLTQRMMLPGSTAEVMVDAADIKEGDFAGLCALQGCYGMVGITREMNRYYLVAMEREQQGSRAANYMPGKILEKKELSDSKVRLLAVTNFENMQDTVEFFYDSGKKWKKIGGKHKLFFSMDHFTGCRYGLFIYSTRETGGSAVFSDFRYYYDGTGEKE